MSTPADAGAGWSFLDAPLGHIQLAAPGGERPDAIVIATCGGRDRRPDLGYSDIRGSEPQHGIPAHQWRDMPGRASHGRDARGTHGQDAHATVAASPADRAALAGAFGVDAGQLVLMEQVHGGSVALVGADDAGRGVASRETAVAGVDALVTQSGDIVLVGLSADCPLVALWDACGGVAALAHAGWRGLVAGVLGATVERMVTVGARAERMRAAVSPSAGPCCYEVGDEVVAALSEAGTPAAVAKGRKSGRWMLDLRAAVVYQLGRAAVAADRVAVHPACTICEPWLHSWRREGRQAGRQALGIRLIGGSDEH